MVLKTPSDSTRAETGSAPVVLVIEPNEEHQVLSTMALGRRGFRVTVAGTAREGLRIALSQRFVAIVLDFKVRDMSALELLAVLAERIPDVPKIFVVSAGQESIAVRALASGASGYLVKTARYNELLPSEVESQIHAAAARRSLKQQRKALGESEERFQKAFRASPIPITLTTAPEGRFLDANDAFLRLVGHAREEVIGHTVFEMNSYVEDAALGGVMRTLSEGATVRDAEMHIRTKGGEVRTVSMSTEKVEIEGSPCLLSLLRDITEERRSERLRASLYEIAEATDSARDLPDLYRRIHEIVAKLMPAENFYIALYDPATDELSFPYFVDAKEPAPAPYRAGKGLTEHVLRTGSALLVSPEVLTSLVQQGKVEIVGVEGVDWLGVPLAVEGRTFGVLAVQSYEEATRYSEREREILSFVSAQVAMAIDRKAGQDALRRAEARFRTMFQEAPMGIVLVSLDGLIQESNPAFNRMLGYSPTEARGKHIQDITAPEDVADSLRLFGAMTRGERTGFILEKRYLRKDGTRMWGRITVTLLKSEGGVPPLSLGMIEDVTEEREAFEAREANSRRFQAMINHISDGISLLGPDGLVAWESPSAHRMFGYPANAALGTTGFSFMHPDDATQLAPVLAELMAVPGKTMTAEFRVRHQDGSWRWVEAIATNLLEDPDLRAIVLNYRDITDRNEALEQIRFQASLLNQVRNAVIAVDRDLRIVYWNEAAAAMYGWRYSEVAGQAVPELLLSSESRAAAAGIIDRVREHGHWSGERNMVRKDGSSFPAEVTLTALRDRHDAIVGYVGVSTDVTERVTARRELEARARQQAAIAALGQKALVEPLLSALMNEAVQALAGTLGVGYAAVLELVPDGSTFSMKARVGWDLPQEERILNGPQETMAGFALSVHAPVIMDDALHEGRFKVEEHFLKRGIVSGIDVVIPGATQPYGVLAVHSREPRRFTEDDVHFCQSVANVIADALERSRIEKILAEKERMASMGQLAAYVAHEVNTPLTNISLLASSIARREKDPEVLEKLEAIGEQRRKATAIITEILEFPRQGSTRRVPEDIRKVVAAAVEQVVPLRKAGVDLVVETGDHAAFANVDAIQIRDVFVSLLKNALDATTKGRVVVALNEWPEFLFISVTDTGTGMTADALEQLFHPLSTLQTPTEGTALGLALSRSIVAAHGGKIEASSEVGKGSTFTVVLPRFVAR